MASSGRCEGWRGGGTPGPLVAKRNLERTLLLSVFPLRAAHSDLDCILFSERSQNRKTMPVFRNVLPPHMCYLLGAHTSVLSLSLGTCWDRASSLLRACYSANANRDSRYVLVACENLALLGGQVQVT